VNTDRSGAQVAVRGEKLGPGSWSPDGKQLLYVTGGAWLTLADAGGENARALFTVLNTGWQPGFSIDRIVWSRDESREHRCVLSQRKLTGCRSRGRQNGGKLLCIKRAEPGGKRPEPFAVEFLKVNVVQQRVQPRGGQFLGFQVPDVDDVQ